MYLAIWVNNTITMADLNKVIQWLKNKLVDLTPIDPSILHDWEQISTGDVGKGLLIDMSGVRNKKLNITLAEARQVRDANLSEPSKVKFDTVQDIGELESKGFRKIDDNDDVGP